MIFFLILYCDINECLLKLFWSGMLDYLPVSFLSSSLIVQRLALIIERSIIVSGLILPARFRQTTPHMLQKRSMNALLAGIFNSLMANRAKLGKRV